MGTANLAMRDAFFDALYDIAVRDSRIILLSDDLGAPSLDKFRANLGGQYFNIGIAEQSMVSIAAGLSLGGKIVFTYGIAPFVTMRCLEQIKVDLCCMNLPVTCLGVGAGYAYGNAGPTHYALEDVSVMSALPGMTVLSPSDNVMVVAFARMACENPGPKYVRFDREKFPLLYDERRADFSDGLAVLKQGRDLTLVATGFMTHRALKVAAGLAGHGVEAGVVDLYRPKPLNEELLLKALAGADRVVTIEEGFLSGGIGSMVAAAIAEGGAGLRLKRFGVPEEFSDRSGGRDEMHRLIGLDEAGITEKTLRWLGK